MATYKKWTDSEIDFIKSNHETMPDELLASKLSQITSCSVTTAMVRRQRRKLQLKKSRGRPRKNGSTPSPSSSVVSETL